MKIESMVAETRCGRRHILHAAVIFPEEILLHANACDV